MVTASPRRDRHASSILAILTRHDNASERDPHARTPILHRPQGRSTGRDEARLYFGTGREHVGGFDVLGERHALQAEPGEHVLHRLTSTAMRLTILLSRGVLMTFCCFGTRRDVVWSDLTGDKDRRCQIVREIRDKKLAPIFG